MKKVHSKVEVNRSHDINPSSNREHMNNVLSDMRNQIDALIDGRISDCGTDCTHMFNFAKTLQLEQIVSELKTALLTGARTDYLMQSVDHCLKSEL